MYSTDEIVELCRKHSRATVRLEFDGKPTGRSHFGGKPEIPSVSGLFGKRTIKYPTFKCSTYDDDDIKLRPLHFLAQIDCAELAAFDKSGLLPRVGTLLFFYQCESNIWGFDPKDRGCARVIYYEGKGEKVDIPEEITEFPEIGVNFSEDVSYPLIEELCCLIGSNDIECESYDAAIDMLGHTGSTRLHKMTGWADTIQNCMEPECELISRRFYLGNGYPALPDREKLFRASLDEWVLLLQLDSFSNGDFEMMFGDCGRIYFFIRKSDLAARDFDKVWMILQT